MSRKIRATDFHVSKFLSSFHLIAASKVERRFATINCIIFWDFLMFYKFFLSPQVKRCAIITYKHGIYEMPHELPTDLGLRILDH